MRLVQGTIGAVAVLAIAGSAFGTGPDIQATFNSISPSVPFSWTFNGGGNTNFDDAGCFNFTRTGGSFTGVTGNFVAFCLELTQPVIEGTNYTYKVVDVENAPNANTPPFTNPLGPAGEALLSELFGRFYPALATGSANNCAAFQLAVWEIVYDPNLIINAPGDTFLLNTPGNPAVLAQAQTYLSSLNGAGPFTPLLGFTNPVVQDQVIPIPAPGALALLGLGTLVVGRRRR